MRNDQWIYLALFELSSFKWIFIQLTLEFDENPINFLSLHFYSIIPFTCRFLFNIYVLCTFLFFFFFFFFFTHTQAQYTQSICEWYENFCFPYSIFRINGTVLLAFFGHFLSKNTYKSLKQQIHCVPEYVFD